MKLWKVILIVLMTFLTPIQMLAQEEQLIGGTREFRSSEEGKSVFLSNGKYQGIKDVSCSFILSTNEAYEIEWFVSNVEQKKNDNYLNVESNIDGLIVSFDIVESGSYRLVLDSVKLKNKEGERDTICKHVIVDSFDIQLYNAPVQRCEGEAVEIEFKIPRVVTSENWTYKWVEEDSILIDWTPINVENETLECKYIPINKWRKSGTEKEELTKALSCIMTDGKTELEEKFMLKIYKNPRTPNSLKPKGNGTSHIYIATSSSKDVDYLFGDGDIVISEKISADAIYENYAFYRYEVKPNDPWVQTLWEYAPLNYENMWKYDSICCYSEKRYLDSNYAQSRGLKLGDGTFFVNLEEATSAMVTLHRLDGKIVWEKHYAPQKDFDENLDFGSMASGIYILKCTIGDQQVVRKFVIR